MVWVCAMGQGLGCRLFTVIMVLSTYKRQAVSDNYSCQGHGYNLAADKRCSKGLCIILDPETCSSTTSLGLMMLHRPVDHRCLWHRQEVNACIIQRKVFHVTLGVRCVFVHMRRLAKLGQATRGLAKLGQARRGLAKLDQARRGLAKLDQARRCLV